MRRSALLVLPSRSESFGSVLVEALACGTPVVATRCGGPEDIVADEVGVLVSKEDPEALAAALEHVLATRGSYDRARLRAHAVRHFSWDGIAGQYAQLYQDVLGQRRPAPAEVEL
jgi:glycosyltransferase involved in cell wall biosynthesis